jgi:hypothetical protein
MDEPSSAAPRDLNGVFFEYPICRKDQHLLFDGLGNQESIKGIAMVEGEIANSQSMPLRNRQAMDALFRQPLR